jgi:hypothetical protein
MNKGKKTQGIALISVLFIAAIVLILASTFIFTIVREQQSNNAAKLVSDALQTADAISERGRLKTVATFHEALGQAPDFVREVYALLKNQPSLSRDADLRATIEASDIMNVNSEDINGKSGRWTVTGATEFNATTQVEPDLYITVSATAETSTGVQTILRQINMGQSQIFDLAMLARNTDCIYCHLRVNGDVGSLGTTFQPGWDNKPGRTSGGDYGGSVVNGDLFLVGKAGTDDGDTDLDADPNTVNGARFTGEIEEDFDGEPLPQQDGVNAFPAIKRDLASTAKGSISGGIIYTVASNETLSGVPTASSDASLEGAQSGNVVLVGTEEDPLVLDGDVYFEGDVVIKGVVQGRGAIYSGRNLYVAGNVEALDPANCKNASNKDSCARQAIRDNKDELRLGARGNIVLGDYTEINDQGETKNWQELQAADYFRSQFGFKNTSTDPKDVKCYDKATGDELEPTKAPDGAITSLKNIDGNEIATSVTDTAVVCVPEKGNLNNDAYSYSMRPGSIDETSGDFVPWLTDGLYQDILGTETRKYDTWRYDIADKSTVDTAEVLKQFGKYNLSAASLDNILKAITGTGGKNFDVTNADGQIIGIVDWDGGQTIRVTIDEAFTYEKQITKVDAFLYSNQRIAGKTFSAPLVINGGMISEEIGILAPGLTKMPYWGDRARYDFFGDPTSSNPANRPDCSQSNAAFLENFVPGKLPEDVTTADTEQLSSFQPDSDDCALTVNYDHRLRNGGLGYNLVSAALGQTLTWQIGDKKSDQVPQ